MAVNTRRAAAARVRLRESFDELVTAIGRSKQHEVRGLLHVSVAPPFASKWLAPRLERFDAAHPDVDVRISATLEGVARDRGGSDASGQSRSRVRAYPL